MADPTLSSTSLPETHILAYITTISSPTRVRRIACVLVFILGIVHVSLAMLLAYMVSGDIREYAFFATGKAWAVGPAATITLGDYLAGTYKYGTDHLFAAALFIAAVLAGPVDLCLAYMINCGNRFATIICRGALVPMLALAPFTAAMLIGYCLLMDASPLTKLWLILLAILGCLLTLLLVDLWRFLAWIARNPAVEKPKEPFLPAGKKSPP